MSFSSLKEFFLLNIFIWIQLLVENPIYNDRKKFLWLKVIIFLFFYFYIFLELKTKADTRKQLGPSVLGRLVNKSNSAAQQFEPVVSIGPTDNEAPSKSFLFFSFFSDFNYILKSNIFAHCHLYDLI